MQRHERCGFNPWVGKTPWGREWEPTPVFLPGESHGQRSLAGYSPWGRKESNTTEATSHTHSMSSAWCQWLHLRAIQTIYWLNEWKLTIITFQSLKSLKSILLFKLPLIVCWMMLLFWEIKTIKHLFSFNNFCLFNFLLQSSNRATCSFCILCWRCVK